MSSSDAAAVPQSFWQRRLLAPIRALLTQGITPDRIALTLGVGTACSLLPFLGFTSLLNLGVGLWFRLNQPILQTLNGRPINNRSRKAIHHTPMMSRKPRRAFPPISHSMGTVTSAKDER